MSTEPQTWHYGVVARYWAAFNTDAEPEGGFFRRFIEEGGEPALDAGCGTGRLIIPWLHARLDVEGCDVSADMIALCRERAEREGLTPNLYVQPMHELDLPRRYRTIVVCGAIGVGSSREQDQQALQRLHGHLEPGGTLVLDNEVPYASPRNWRYWLKENRSELPLPWHPWGERQRGSDGAEYCLRTRLVDIDPLSQSVRAEIQAQMWRDGELVAEERFPIDLMAYFRDELVIMLDRAGFSSVEVKGGYEGAEPSPEHDFLVYIARR
jgi:SAM-dependent methyltransferase